MTFDLYAWKTPRDLDADGAAALVQRWHDEGADPAASPFEPSEDVGWFHRELTRDEPDLDVVSDAVPNPSTRPVWLATDRAPPARLVAIRLAPDTTREAVNDILSLGVKYDLVLFDRPSAPGPPATGGDGGTRERHVLAGRRRPGRGGGRVRPGACDRRLVPSDPHRGLDPDHRRRIHVRDGRVHVRPRGPRGAARPRLPGRHAAWLEHRNNAAGWAPRPTRRRSCIRGDEHRAMPCASRSAERPHADMDK